MNGWISTEERKPTKSDWYLVVVATQWGGHMVLMGWYMFLSSRWNVESDGEAKGDPIYWQPVPALPEGL